MALLLTGLLVASIVLAPVTAGQAEQSAVDSSVSAAAALGIGQSIAVVDRATGETVASSGSEQLYISESIVKLFTVAYYEVQAGGAPDDAMSARLRTMIEKSDDGIESDLWNTDIVPAMAQRYGLEHTSNGPKTGPHDWGWELITAGDEAKFLYEMANDPEVGPLLMDAMANVAPSGSDGFDQAYGLNALSGAHGSKQGWTDVDEATDQIQIHSVGWTDRYFVAILQTSTESDDDTMRTAATAAAQAIQGAQSAASTNDAGPAQSTDEPAADPALAGQLSASFGRLGPEVSATLRRLLGVG